MPTIFVRELSSIRMICSGVFRLSSTTLWRAQRGGLTPLCLPCSPATILSLQIAMSLREESPLLQMNLTQKMGKEPRQNKKDPRAESMEKFPQYIMPDR